MTIIWQSFFLGTRFLKTWQTEIEKTILKIDGIEKIILKIKEEAKEKSPLYRIKNDEIFLFENKTSKEPFLI